jgi:hypothetical protein
MGTLDEIDLVRDPEIPSISSTVNNLSVTGREGTLDCVGVRRARMKVGVGLASRFTTDQQEDPTNECITDPEIPEVVEMLVVAPQQIGPGDPQRPGHEEWPPQVDLIAEDVKV